VSLGIFSSLVLPNSNLFLGPESPVSLVVRDLLTARLLDLPESVIAWLDHYLVIPLPLLEIVCDITIEAYHSTQSIFFTPFASLRKITIPWNTPW